MKLHQEGRVSFFKDCVCMYSAHIHINRLQQWMWVEKGFPNDMEQWNVWYSYINKDSAATYARWMHVSPGYLLHNDKQ